MKLLVSFNLVFILLLIHSKKSFSQVVGDQVHYMTYGSFVTSIDRDPLITFAAKVVNNGGGVFLNAGSGDFSKTSYSNFLAVVDPKLGKVAVRPARGGNAFEIGSDSNFQRIIAVRPYISFLGWDGNYYTLSFDVFQRLIGR